jgi:hypothetical protein
VRPLLLLDVDGVLNVPGAAEQHEIELPGLVVLVSFPESIRWRLARLDAVYDIVWLTSWGRWAPEHLGPLLGFEWPSAWEPQPGETQAAKVGVARTWAGDDRPFAWVDDLTFPEAFSWLEERPAPSTVPHVMADVGLSEAITTDLVTWAAHLPADGPDPG